MSSCVCGSGQPLEKCCGPLLEGQPAPTAESLMRSRYAAYVLGKIDYLEKTCCAEERKTFNRQEAQQIIDETKWLGLEVYRTVDGGIDDATGQVDFAFRFSQGGDTHAQHELATFCREDGAWRYESSVMNPKGPPVRTVQIGRNDPCSCGSGKKYKKCCGA